MVKDILVKEFSDVFDVGFTATMENSLDKMELGEADWVAVLKDFYGPFSRRLEGVKANITDLKAANQTITGRTCPECGKFPLVVKWSKNGKFLACQGFPACRYTEPFEKVAPQQSGREMRQVRRAHGGAQHQRQPVPRLLAVPGMQEHQVDINRRRVPARGLHGPAH